MKKRENTMRSSRDTIFGKGQKPGFGPEHRGSGVLRTSKFGLGLDYLDSDVLGQVVEKLDPFSAVSFFKTCKKAHDNNSLRDLAKRKSLIRGVYFGLDYTMMLCGSGALYACGKNDQGQLGLGDEENRSTFTRVEGLPNGIRIKQLVCGSRHTMLLCERGALYVCGNNGFGQLGLGNRWNKPAFTRVEGIPIGVRIKQLVHNTENSSMLLCERGALYVCGGDSFGQLGLGESRDQTTFKRVEGIPVGVSIKQVVSGGSGTNTMLLCESGGLYVCGRNIYGELGLGDEENRSTFTRVEGLPAGVCIKQLVCKHHTVLLCETGALYVCGCNKFGQLGLGDREHRAFFERVQGLPVGVRIKQLVCGEYNTILLCESGALYVCGWNKFGQLGLSDREDQTTFTRVQGLPASVRIKQLVSGYTHTILLCESGAFYVCGRNLDGELGLGDRGDRDIFTRVEGLPTGVRLEQLVCQGSCCGRRYTMLLCKNGDFYACGDNELGQLGLGDKEYRDTFVRLEKGLPRWEWADIHTKDDSPSMSMS